MFVTARLRNKNPQSTANLLVPRTAILWSGKRSVVYVKVPSSSTAAFEMREVQVSPQGEAYRVESGLSSGEEIAVQGVFAIDASAQLSGKQSMMSRPAGTYTEMSYAFRSNGSSVVAQYFKLKNALVKMGNRADVKVISMSIGTPFYSSVIEDGVNYAWGAGKMMMAAAGTSFSWTSWWGVVYPAALSRCVAITGVKENFGTCASCHDGSEVDFTVTMERSSNSSRNTLSLNTSGYAAKYIGGSSSATAMASGIAAMVWSVNPSRTREQVYQNLLTTSQYYPNPNGSRGYGNLNAGAAVSAAQAGI
jgi:hypothetical protein